jgi:hypothetical protein
MVNGLLSPSSTALATRVMPPASFDTNHSAPHLRFLRSSASGAAGSGAGRGRGGVQGEAFGEGGGRELRHVDFTPGDERGPPGGVSGTDATAGGAAAARFREQQANVQREVVEELCVCVCVCVCVHYTQTHTHTHRERERERETDRERDR